MEATVDLPWWHGPVLQGGSPASLLFDDRVFVRHDGAWASIPSPYAEELSNASALGLGGERVLLTWKAEPYARTNGAVGFTPHAAEWDGAAWSPREAGLPTELITDRALAQSQDGSAWLAYTTLDGEIRLLHWVEDRWVGVDGSDVGGGVSNSPADSYGPAIGFIEGNVCVAWSEAADLAARVNVRCHRLPG